jgi:hypothetical protein
MCSSISERGSAMQKELPESDPRAKRYYLSAEDYGLPSGTPYVPMGSIDIDIWKQLVTCPDSALLKTTDYRAAELKAACELHARLLDCAEVLEQRNGGTAPLHLQVLSAYEDLDSSLYNAAVGWYRTAGLCLRTALDDTLLGLYYDKQTAKLAEFENVIDGGARSKQVREMLRELHSRSSDSTFDPKSGQFILLYDTLSTYQHRISNFALVDSTGPIFDAEAFDRWNNEFADVCDLILDKAT